MQSTTTMSRYFRTLAGAFALALAGAVLAPTNANAAFTAANTNIINIATVNWTDVSSNPYSQQSLPVTVTVSLIKAAPNFSAPTPLTQNIPQGAGASFTLFISSNANGPDTYTLSDVEAPTNISSSTGQAFASGNTVLLGATTLAQAASAGATTIQVPYDLGYSGHVDGSVNGLVVNDTIWVGGGHAKITAISVGPAGGVAQPGYPSGNEVTVTLTNSGGAGICPSGCSIGSPVGQSVLLTWSFTASGTVTSAPSGNYTETVSGASSAGGTGGGLSATATAATIIVGLPSLTVTKLVSTDGGATFHATAPAAPGATLIYQVTAVNESLQSSQNVQFSDVLPEYLTYVATKAKFGTFSGVAGSQPLYSSGSLTALTEGSGGFSFTAGTGAIKYLPSAAVNLCGTAAGPAPCATPLTSPNYYGAVLYYEATVN